MIHQLRAGETLMTTQLQLAKDQLFGDEGLRASNFKMFPGNARDASAESVAEEFNASLARVAAGEFEVVADIG